uniref:Ectonucleotide pyrophosphatase/phosphodiesterase family member 5 n=1 Tax=Trichuris muris TaxID=70415 RepID=A0A5S6QSK1_TRIMR
MRFRLAGNSMSAFNLKSFLCCFGVVMSIGLIGVFTDVLLSQHLWPLANCRTHRTGEDRPLLLLVSYDGFRWDYLRKSEQLYSFRYLIKHGVHAVTGLLNSYVTLTAPNHYGIVTGLYEESHGIVDNNFYDPTLDKTFNYFDETNRTDPAFFGGEPLWILNEQSGPTRFSGCVMWVGCDVAISGSLPTHYVSYDDHMSWESRVEHIISWFLHPEKPINFGLLYVEEPDATGHKVGPDSPEIAKVVERLDGLTSYLLGRLYEEKLLDRVNIIFTSDHGMASVLASNAVHLDEMLEPNTYRVFGGATSLNLLPNAGKEEEIFQSLDGKHPHMKVHKKDSIPEEYHYRNSERIMPIHLEADIHWFIADGLSASEKTELPLTGGMHGYNNSLPDMQPYFIALGPAFKTGVQVPSFENVDIYELICYVLDLEPKPNNGSFERVRYMLKGEGVKPGRGRTLFTNVHSVATCLYTAITRASMNGFLIFFTFFCLLALLIAYAYVQARFHLAGKSMLAKKYSTDVP